MIKHTPGRYFVRTVVGSVVFPPQYPVPFHLKNFNMHIALRLRVRSWKTRRHHVLVLPVTLLSCTSNHAVTAAYRCAPQRITITLAFKGTILEQLFQQAL